MRAFQGTEIGTEMGVLGGTEIGPQMGWFECRIEA